MHGQQIEAAAEHVTQTADLAQPVRDGVAKLLRAAAYVVDRLHPAVCRLGQ